MPVARRITCVVMGDGGWGTALAIHLHRLGHRVRWWGAFPEYLRVLDRTRVNRKFLPGIPIPNGIRIEPMLSDAVAGTDLVILAIPSQHLRHTIERLTWCRPLWRSAVVVSTTKGLEQETLKRMSQVVDNTIRPARLAVLSGPSIAADVGHGLATTAVVASRRSADAAAVQRWMMDNTLRLYTSSDVVGVELGGALKNPIAIAAGVSDGLGLGSNAKAALITRGIVEMARLGTALGARRQTFWGLSGLGDLVTTCLSGRNYWFGVRLGKGQSLKAILASTPMIIEGVPAAKAAVALAHKHRIELPIIEQVHRILFRGQSPRKALHALMRRAEKAESS